MRRPSFFLWHCWKSQHVDDLRPLFSGAWIRSIYVKAPGQSPGTHKNKNATLKSVVVSRVGIFIFRWV